MESHTQGAFRDLKSKVRALKLTIYNLLNLCPRQELGWQWVLAWSCFRAADRSGKSMASRFGILFIP